jgi:hypothetical protein
MDHPSHDRAATRRFDDQLHGAISEKDGVTRTSLSGKPRKRNRCASEFADPTVGIERPSISFADGVPGLFQIPETDLWTLEVGDESDRRAASTNDLVYGPQGGPMLGIRSVGEIQAKGIHAALDQPGEDGGTRTRRSDRGEDLRPAHGSQHP